jgi:hypothetical protein
MSRRMSKLQTFMGQWRSLREVACHLGCCETSASARLRDLRKRENGGFTVERKRKRDGTNLYRVA